MLIYIQFNLMKDNKTKKHSKRVREREGEIDNKEIRKIIRKYNKLLIFFLFIIIINARNYVD